MTTYPRAKYRREMRRWLRANALPLGLFTAAILLVLGLESIFLSGYVLGLVQAAVAAIWIFAVLTIFHITTGAIWQLAGAWGEQNTRDLLARAQRKKLIWASVDSLAVQSGDIDHLVLMRDGRILALDSKWYGRAQTHEMLRRAAEKSREAARRASLVLRSLDLPRDAEPAVVLWGQRDKVPDDAIYDGVPFVRGELLVQWLDQNDGANVREEDAHKLILKLNEFKAKVRPDSE